MAKTQTKPDQIQPGLANQALLTNSTGDGVEWTALPGGSTIDSSFNNTSTNALENQVITEERDLLRNEIRTSSIFRSRNVPHIIASYRSGTQSTGEPDGNDIVFDREVLSLTFIGATLNHVLFIDTTIGDQLTNNALNCLEIPGNEFYFQLSRVRELSVGSGLETVIPDITGYAFTTELNIPNLPANYKAYDIQNGNTNTSDSPNPTGFDSLVTIMLNKVNPPSGLTATYEVTESGDTYEYVYENGILKSRTLQVS